MLFLLFLRVLLLRALLPGERWSLFVESVPHVFVAVVGNHKALPMERGAQPKRVHTEHIKCEAL